MYNILKDLVLPPADFLCVLIVGLLLLWCGLRRMGLTLVVIGVAVAYLFSTPLIAGMMGRVIQTTPVFEQNSSPPAGAEAGRQA